MKIPRIITCTWVLLMTMMFAPNLSAQTFEYPEYQGDEYEPFPVNIQGKQPTITDFANTFLNLKKEEKFFNNVYKDWNNYLKKKPLSKNVSIILDVKNGYMKYNIINPVGIFNPEDINPENINPEDTIFMEMCFWNCADGKHKLVAANTVWVMDNDYGWDDFIGVYFYLYDDKKRTMRMILPEDIGALFDGDGLSVFFLPRKGKNIHVSAAGGGDRWDEILIWDGYKFD